MGEVAGENRNERQKTGAHRNPRFWINCGLAMVLGAGCAMYLAQLRDQVQRLAALERSLHDAVTAQRLEIAALAASRDATQREPADVAEPAPEALVDVAEPAPEALADAAEAGRKINVNTASFAVLASLPGVGEVTAREIVAYRHAHGDFHRLQDLRNVRGIGYEKLRWLENLVTV